MIHTGARQCTPAGPYIDFFRGLMQDSAFVGSNFVKLLRDRGIKTLQD